MAGLLTLDSDLASYLRDQARMPWVWGGADCALFIADWVFRRTGRDGAIALRGRYATADGAARLLGRRRGLVGIVDACALPVGCDRTRRPALGDIGVIAAPRGEADRVPVCAIRLHGGWISRANHLLVRLGDADAHCVAAWALPEDGRG